MLLNSHGRMIQNIDLKDKKIIMFGASTRNKAAIEALSIAENIQFIVDSNEDKVGLLFDNYPVRAVSSLCDYKDCVIISVLVSTYTDILKTLQHNGIDDCFFYYPEFFKMEEVFSSNKEVLRKEQHYRYIHIFSNDKFVIPFYQMLKEHFMIEEHLLILAYRIKDDFAGILPFVMKECKKYHNVLILDDVHGSITNDITDKKRLIPMELDCNQDFYSDAMKELCSHAYRIILHSAFWGNETKKLVYTLTQLYASKLVWACFGGDSYFDKDSFEVKEILCKIGGCVLSSGLYDIVKKNYNICGKIDNTLFYIYISKSVIKKTPIHDFTHILLGHSAFEYVNHMAGFQLLHKYADENIKIYCPLSYGAIDYRNEVIREGKKLFGDKFIPILNYIKPKEYFEFLQTIDVAVFPNKRLTAESTILLLKAAGVKIYANIDVMDYMQDDLVHMENIANIPKQSFEEFVSQQRKESCDADDVNKFVANKWRDFFNGL